MTTWTFWADALERAVKTAAQSILLGLGMGEGFSLYDFDLAVAAGFAGGGFLLSVLTSIASYRVTRTPSLVAPTTITRHF